MTFIQAAIQILRENDNQPLSPVEIWKRIVKQQLATTTGKTPFATLDSSMRVYQLNSRIAKAALAKRNSRNIILFVEAAPGKFKLTDKVFESFTTTSSALPISKTTLPTIPDIVSTKQCLYQIVDESLGWKNLSVYRYADNIIEYTLNDCPQYTYVFNTPLGATVKIGRSNNTARRLKQFLTGNPDLILNHCFPASQYSDHALYDRFDHLRVRNTREWFHLTKELQHFLSTERAKHAKTLASYRKFLEAKSLEQVMIDSL